MFGPPLGGKLIDRFGPKPVMSGGLLVSALGFVFIATVCLNNASAVLLVIGLGIMGLGLGFVMGAPTNYMVLENTNPSQSGAAIATIALVRQIGTTVAPALLLGFVAASPGAAGFFQMLMCAAAFCVISLVLMAFYRKQPLE